MTSHQLSSDAMIGPDASQQANSQLPRDGTLDSTLRFARQGYEFISRGCARHQSDAFETRLLGRRTVCLRGADAARLFYDQRFIERSGAAPSRVIDTLFGRGGVQGLDGDGHRHRKAQFMALMSPERIRQLTSRTLYEFREARARWARVSRIRLQRESREVLFRAVCSWANVPVKEREVRRRASQMGQLIDSPARLGVRHWRGRWARSSLEKWLRGLVADVREGRLDPEEDSALHAFAAHLTPSQELLDERIAAVELLNVLRPVVAVARYVAFAGLALHQYPQELERLRAGGSEDDEHFVHELRRFYPFFPCVAGRSKVECSWHGYLIPAQVRVLFDLYGTNHDGRIWDEPESFDSSRFARQDCDAFQLVPHGGGDQHTGHRCAGEQATIELLKAITRFLVHELDYDVPDQATRISLRSMPARPPHGFFISRVRAREGALLAEQPEREGRLG